MKLHGLEADAVLFDCDGVLVDSEPVSFSAWAETLAGHGYALQESEFAESIGGTETTVAERYAPILSLDPVALELEAQFAFERIAPRVTGFPDTIELVGRLERSHVPIAVATNGLRWRLDVLLRAVGLGHLLDVSVTADEVATPKPAPDLYLAAARLAGVDPDRCVVIEDSPLGIAAALQAGCRVIAVDRGVFASDRLAGADVIVERV